MEPEQNNEKKDGPGGRVEPLVMTDQELHINSLAEHVQANAECLERFILIFCNTLPIASESVEQLMSEWKRINNSINCAFKKDLENLKET